VQLGLFLPTASPFADADWLKAVATETEERGIDAIWIPEHVVQFGDYESRYPYSPDGKIPTGPQSGMLEPFTTLAFLAASTSSVRLGTAICLLAQRNPVYAAKEASNLDWLSKGRVDLGIGVGWLREEYEAVGVPWPKRGSRTEECVEVLKTLWCDDVSSYKGEFYDLPACSMYPKPVQDPHPPVHFGGESDAAISRAARIGQGWHTFGRLPADVPAVLETLNRELGGCGRTRAEFQVTVSPYLHPVDPAMVDQYAETGIDQLTLMLMAFSASDIAAALDALEPCFERARRS
jgi:probable F420-dependent oxidoreductase